NLCIIKISKIISSFRRKSLKIAISFKTNTGYKKYFIKHINKIINCYLYFDWIITEVIKS
ncbi:hypothetical protein, partial [Campylobacter sputorum]|uniref:hypothetical protein n=1 Tax=Campylobacter sputorum TaxID=206 RepID=UPI001E41FFF8